MRGSPVLCAADAWGMGAQQSQVFIWGSTSAPNRLISSLHGQVCQDVAIGGNHNAVVLANGECYTWGSNKYGQLGHRRQNAVISSLDDPAVPRLVSYFVSEGILVLSVSCGEAHTAALTNDGLLYTWGCSQNGRLGREGSNTIPCVVSTLAKSPVLAVSCGGYHTAALTDSGRAYTWGLGAEGRLGHGNDMDQHVPLAVEIGTDAASDPPVKQIVSGGHHTIAIVTGRNGHPPAVYSWGGGSFGKLGHGDEVPQNRPTPINLFAGMVLGEGDYVVQVAAGGQHSAAILASGALYVWGQSAQGRLGLPQITGNVTSPTRVVGMDAACRVSCGEQHTCVVTEIADLYYCGLRHARAQAVTTFTKVDFLENSAAVEYVEAGEGHTIILARQDRHAVMRVLDRDHHGPFPSSPSPAKAMARPKQSPMVYSPSTVPAMMETDVVKSDELVSTLSRRIQDLEEEKKTLEHELSRAKARNAILESMLHKALDPIKET